MSDSGAKEAGGSEKVETPLYQLESRKNFSESSLWQFQQKYYEEAGVTAWSSGAVPFYITSNPQIANSYAEMVWAFFQDQQQLLSADNLKERLYIFELGTGSGRFSFYFITRLARLCQDAGLDPAQTFCYVMTDVVAANLEFVDQHPSLQPFFESGFLETAYFDVTRPGAFTLKNSGLEIAPGSLVRPPVVIGNYVFDSVPVDIFYFKGKVWRGLLSLSVAQEYLEQGVQEQFSHLQYQYNFVPVTDKAYPEPDFEAIINSYRDNLKDAYILFPVAALHCLEWWYSLSKNGFLLLSADKGEYRLPALEGQTLPKVVQHGGSFSFDVDFYALKLFCEQKGGLSFFPDFPDMINVAALVFTNRAASYNNTRSVYRRFSQEFSASDFYRVIQLAGKNFASLSLREMFAYLRFSHFDSELFGHFFSRLLEIIPTIRAEERQEVKAIVDEMWNMYFSIDPDYNLAEYCATLLFALDDFRGAITYFNHAVTLYGPRPNFLYNLAVCHYQLDETEPAIALLKTVLEQDGSNEEAAGLLAELQSLA